MKLKKWAFILLLVLAAGFPGFGQIKRPVHWSYAAKRTSAVEAVLYFKATVDPGWHIYSTLLQDGGPEKTVFRFERSGDFELLGRVIEPKPIRRYEETYGFDLLYFEKSVVFRQRVRLKRKDVVVRGRAVFMVCTDRECLPVDEVAFSVPVK